MKPWGSGPAFSNSISSFRVATFCLSPAPFVISVDVAIVRTWAQGMGSDRRFGDDSLNNSDGKVVSNVSEK